MKLSTSVAFAADIVSDTNPGSDGYFVVPKWRTSGSSGLFDTTNGAFEPNSGVFTVRHWADAGRGIGMEMIFWTHDGERGKGNAIPMRAGTERRSVGGEGGYVLGIRVCARPCLRPQSITPGDASPVQAPVTGIYYAACDIRVDGAGGGYVRIILDVSRDGGNKYDNGLHHIRSRMPAYYTGSPSGTRCGVESVRLCVREPRFAPGCARSRSHWRAVAVAPSQA